MSSKNFPMAVILSVYQDRLMCNFADYRDFLNHMTGGKVWLHDVAAARRIVGPWLGKRIPELKSAPPPPEKTDAGAGNRHIKAVCKKLGYDSYTLAPMPKGAFKFRTGEEALR